MQFGRGQRAHARRGRRKWSRQKAKTRFTWPLTAFDVAAVAAVDKNRWRPAVRSAALASRHCAGIRQLQTTGLAVYIDSLTLNAHPLVCSIVPTRAVAIVVVVVVVVKCSLSLSQCFVGVCNPNNGVRVSHAIPPPLQYYALLNNKQWKRPKYGRTLLDASISTSRQTHNAQRTTFHVVGGTEPLEPPTTWKVVRCSPSASLLISKHQVTYADILVADTIVQGSVMTLIRRGG